MQCIKLHTNCVGERRKAFPCWATAVIIHSHRPILTSSPLNALWTSKQAKLCLVSVHTEHLICECWWQLGSNAEASCCLPSYFLPQCTRGWDLHWGWGWHLDHHRGAWMFPWAGVNERASYHDLVGRWANHDSFHYGYQSTIVNTTSGSQEITGLTAVVLAW